MNERPRDCWETPLPLFELLDDEFAFTLDAAAKMCNRKCMDFLGPDNDDPAKQDALGTPWRNNVVWLNPPYSDVFPWVHKAYIESQLGATVVVLVKNDPSTAWWVEWAMRATEIRLLIGARVQFVPPEGVKKSSNSHTSAVLIFRPFAMGTKPMIDCWRWKEELDSKTYRETQMSLC